MKTCQKIAAVLWMVLVPVMPTPAAAEADRLTPSDAEIVVQVNVRQLLQTPLVQKHALDALKTLLERNREVRQLLHAAGLSPLKDIDTIAVCASGKPLSSGKLLIVVRGSFTPEKARTAAEDYAKKHPNNLKIKSFKDPTKLMWEIHSDDKSFYAAFADDKTLVMTTTEEETNAVVRRAGQAAERPSAALQAALDHLKGSESIWMALAATEDIKQMLQSEATAKDFATALQSVTGALEVSNDAQLGVVVHTNSAKAAAQIKNKLDELMPLLAFLGAGKDKSGQVAKEVIENIKLKAEKNDVSIRLHISDAQIEKARKKDR
ncbi:MAG: hypothetical protein ACYC3I_08185 [Gemmataceae bacterium]